MITGIVRLRSLCVLAGFVAVGAAACSSDDTTTGSAGSGGSAGATGGKGGAAGTAGSAGRATGGSAGASGSAGTAGSGGSAGSAGTGGKGGSAGTGGVGDGGPVDGNVRDVPTDCGVPGIIHTAPTVPAPIAAPAGVVLVAGYRAVGDQIYTCVASTSDAGTDGGDGGPSGTWVNTAVATVYGDNCAVAAQHSYTSGPTWAANDGSTVVGARVSAFTAPGSDGGDGGGAAITWVLLRAAINTGEGVFSNVTYVQRLETVGGLGPSGSCDPTSDASATVRSPYSATYYFYTGGNSTDASGEAATESGSDSGSD